MEEEAEGFRSEIRGQKVEMAALKESLVSIRDERDAALRARGAMENEKFVFQGR